MAAAKYYTYRNLNFEDNFSVKYKGKVVGYYNSAFIYRGTFKVSEAGQARCIQTGKRNVHAFIVSDSLPRITSPDVSQVKSCLLEVQYNPFRAKSFVYKQTGKPVEGPQDIYLIDGRCYVTRMCRRCDGSGMGTDEDYILPPSYHELLYCDPRPCSQCHGNGVLYDYED